MDDHLVREIEKNNELAFRTLIEKYQKLVYSAAFKLLRNAEDAEDVCQEVFLSVYRNISQVRNREDLSGWLFRASCNKALSQLRKKRSSRFEVQAPEAKSEERKKDSPEPVELRTPDLELEQKELSEELFSAIQNLPDLQQKVLLMHKFENLSHQEIGEKLELSQASVESLIYRAKCNLRKSLFVYFKTNYNQGL